jgi:lysine-specific demethylase 8
LLSQFLPDDIYLLKCILCGGYTDELQDSVMWFSNGGTKSVLHYDAIDNINCLMSGTKELYMVDKVN